MANFAFAILFSVTFATGLFAQTSSAETNVDRQARIDELTKRIDEQVATTRDLNKQGGDIQSQIDALKREREYLQQQMEKTAIRQTELVKQMADTEIRIQQQKDALGNAMAEAYVQESISPIEMIASSDSIGDYIDQQTMNEVVRDKLSTSITEVKNLKIKLLAQQQEMKRIAGDQYNESLALEGKQADQQKMLVAATSQSGKLEQITKQMAEERAGLQRQQQASIANTMGGAEQVSPGTVSKPVVVISEPAPIIVTPTPAPQSPVAPSTPTPTTPAPTPTTPTPAPVPEQVVLPNGGYPSYLQNCYVDQYALSYGIDPWGYGCRQCVSYTAWKVFQKTGQAAMYWGNAKDWPASATRVGYESGPTPRAGSVGVMTGGPYGHVVWVESVNDDGTINISQYNYWLPNKSNGGWGWYSEFRNVSPWAYQVYIYV
jgi:surface antigen/peptidoglycan hydrolase CwlO-like protein